MVASKRDAIAAIIERNPTANPAFLSEFSKGELEQYLDRLGRAIEADDDFESLHPRHPTPTETNSHHDESSDDRWW